LTTKTIKHRPNKITTDALPPLPDAADRSLVLRSRISTTQSHSTFSQTSGRHKISLAQYL